VNYAAAAVYSGQADCVGANHVRRPAQGPDYFGGINISPVELEAAIADLDGVAEVAVIPAPDPRFGETPAAIVVAELGREDINEMRVITHCARVLADYKVPRYVVLRTDPLPRLPSGKIAKQVVREQYRDIAERFAKTR